MDPTHVFRCIYNNFQCRKDCPKFDYVSITANFNHLKELYQIEQTKMVKMAYQLNDKCLNPQPIEKSNVSLAASVFSESTRNATQFYVNNGYPHCEGTLEFLKIISKWWDILNVKSTSKGKHKRDINSDPITNTNYNVVAEFFKKIVDWLIKWQSSGKVGFSAETFKTFKHTSTSFPLLVKFLLDEKKLNYVLSGKIQSDFIEKTFGRYRQLSGANYFATERQFIEAEKAIRVKSLIKISMYSIKDVVSILKVDENKFEKDISSHSETVMNMISEDIDCESTHMDNNIIYYVASFIARSLKLLNVTNALAFLESMNNFLFPIL